MTLGIQYSVWQVITILRPQWPTDSDSEAVLRPVNCSPPPTNSLPLSRYIRFNKPFIYSSLHVSHSPFGVLVLKPILQFSTNSHQCSGRIQEAHQERPTCAPPCHQASILQLSQCHSCCSSPATPRSRSVPKER